MHCLVVNNYLRKSKQHFCEFTQLACGVLKDSSYENNLLKFERVRVRLRTVRASVSLCGKYSAFVFHFKAATTNREKNTREMQRTLSEFRYPNNRAQRRETPFWRRTRFTCLSEQSIGSGKSGADKTVRKNSSESEENCEASPICRWKTFQVAQRCVKRQTPAEAAKTVICNGRFGVLSAVSSRDDLFGCPVGSYVNYVADPLGKPIFSVTTKADHTKDMFKNEKISLFVLEGNSLDAREQQAVLTGFVEPVEESIETVREMYLEKSPDSFWVDFGDFRWFHLQTVLNVRYIPDVQNIARNIKGVDYYEAEADPIASYSVEVAEEVNSSNSVEIMKLSERVVGEPLDKASLKRIDRFGLDLRCSKPGFKHFNCRVAFPKVVTSVEQAQKQIQELLDCKE